MKDESGQIAIDFLAGLSLFLIALTFTVQFVPGLFSTISSSDEDLSIISYRTATILSEDPGWWDEKSGAPNSTGTDWEDHTDHVFRLGFAEDSSHQSRTTNKPNILNYSKIESTQGLNEDEIITMLGLFDNINGARIEYEYNISILQNGIPVRIANQTATFGTQSPDMDNVFQTKRLVLVEKGEIANFSADDLNASSTNENMVILNITGPIEKNIIVQISGFNVTNNTSYMNSKLNGDLLIQDSQNYSAYIKKDGSNDFRPYTDPDSINPNDTLKLVYYQDIFNETHNQLGINFSEMNIAQGPPYIEYAYYAKQHYEKAELVVKVWR